MARTAGIAGATGLVGGYCLSELQDRPEYSSAIVLTRRAVPLAESPKIERRVVDFNRLSAADLAGADDVFCALGTTIKKSGSQAEFRKVDFDAVVNLARASVEAGAKRFVLVSSIGADPKSKNFYLRVKGETEQAISALPLEAIHIMRPSLLLGKRQESRTGEGLGQAVMPILNWALIGPLRKYRAIPAETVAKAMVNAAHSPTTGLHIYDYAQIAALSLIDDRSFSH